ncbi:hydroxymethylbilane synthase [Halanaerocella petrolearia]
MREIIIGTRPSNLAVAQAKLIANKLKNKFSDYNFKLKKISTKGDRILDKELSKIEGKGLFIKEIEVALLNGEIDLAVHSYKDLPAQLADGLEVVATPRRANPLDALISKEELTLDQLPQGAKLGTGSLRRKSQLLHYRSDLEIVPIRGNIDTRLQKLKQHDLEGIILAAAGLERMGWQDKITQYLEPEISIPAARQGILAIEARVEDKELKELLQEINNQSTADVARAEHSFLDYLQGGCKVPVGAYAQLKGDELVIEGVVAKLDGSKVLRDKIIGTREDARDLGIKLAKSLEEQGAREILAKIKGGTN